MTPRLPRFTPQELLNLLEQLQPHRATLGPDLFRKVAAAIKGYTKPFQYWWLVRDHFGGKHHEAVFEALSEYLGGTPSAETLRKGFYQINKSLPRQQQGKKNLRRRRLGTRSRKRVAR